MCLVPQPYVTKFPVHVAYSTIIVFANVECFVVEAFVRSLEVGMLPFLGEMISGNKVSRMKLVHLCGRGNMA